MSKYRKSMSDHRSQKLFTRGARIHPKNIRPVSSRGGERL